LADPNTRQGKRTPVTLKIKFKSETIEQFIERYAVDVSQGGIFIRTKEPLAVGTQMKFEFQLRDASPLIAGEGTVVWTRENDPSRPAIAPGMGVRFDRLNDGSQTVLERILAEKAKQAPQRGGVGASSGDGPSKPLFTDTPTKVAPAPVQEALGVRRSRHDSEQTPLPNPMPFHSDADDFDERAFEEATKVRALEELAAQTALGEGDEVGDDTRPDTALPADELAARRARAESGPAEPPPPDELPAAPEQSGRQPRLLDTTPSPRSTDRQDEPMGRTRLGVEPARATGSGRISQVRDTGAAAELSSPMVAEKKSSSAGIIIALLVLVAAGAGALWWFVLREQVSEQVASPTKPEPGSAIGSGGSAAVAVGSNGSAGSAGSQAAGSNVVETPKGPTVDTVIASNTKAATVEIIGTDQKGPAPFTAKLEKDKAYKAKVTAPGFAPTELEIKGGQDKATAKLVAKTKVISVTSDPPGADIYVDGANTKQITPAEVELTAAQAAKSKVRVSLRRTGYRAENAVVETAAFKDDESKLMAKLEVKLQKAAAGGGTTGGGTTGGGHTGSSGAGSGSATPAGTGSGGTGSGSTGGTGSAGSAATPPTPPSGGGGGGGGTGSAAKPPAGSGATPAPAPTPSANMPSTGATPSATTSSVTTEPTPTWTK